MARANAPTLPIYLSRLEGEPELLDDLVAEITVGETYFFRDAGQLAVIKDEILPYVARAGSRPLRLWSAGCATGEEAYTLAMLLDQSGLRMGASILATDLSRRALARARHARYGRWSLRGVPADVVSKYFTERGAEFELAPALRTSVEFRYLNLAADTYPSLASGIAAMDLVLCRNVLIYFDAKTVARVAERLIASIAADGWLVTGASDPPLGDLVPCEVVVTSAGLVYRRRGRSFASSVASARQPRQKGDDAKGDAPALPTPAPPPDRGPTEQAPAPPPPPTPPPTVQSSAADLEEALSAYAARDYARAAAAAERATHSASAEAAAWVVLVRCHANLGALDAAGRACAAGLDRFRTSLELAYLHGVLLLESGQAEAAAAALRRALYLDRSLAVAHLALAEARAKTGDSRGAVAALRSAERLLGKMPQDAQVQAGDGERAGRLREAARVRIALMSAESR